MRDTSATSQFEASLNQSELEAARRIARRLVEELRRAIRLLPVEARSTSAMATRLGIEKTTCHRIVSTAAGGRDPTELALTELPGPKALRHFVAALRGAGHGDVELDELTVAIDLYANFFRDTGGSQAALGRRLRAPGHTIAESITPSNPREFEPDRATRMFRDAADISGSEAFTDHSIRVLRKLRGDFPRIEETLCRGFHRYHATPIARPLAIWTTIGARRHVDGTETPHDSVDLKGDSPLGVTENCVVHEFSSNPLPTIHGVEIGRNRGLINVVDSKSSLPGTPGSGPDSAIDIVTLNRHRSAASQDPNFRLSDKEFWYLSNYPARHLLIDLYIEKSFFVVPNLPVVGCHTWDPSFETGNAPRWLSELQSSLNLSILHPTFHHAAHDCYPNAVALTRHVFSALDADRSQFNGFRLHVQYPIWRTLYRIGIDFVGGEIPGAEKKPQK